MRTSLTTSVILACLSLVAAAPAVAQPSPVTLAGSELHQLRTPLGTVYELYVALPDEYGDSGETTFPVLYLTDTGQFFGMVLESYRLLRLGQEVSPVILVGVERQVDGDVPWLVRRTIDLTPTESPQGVRSLEQMYGRDVPSGGADVFLSAVVDEVIPWVEARYRELSES